MACMTPATEGTRISVDDPEARAFRAQVIEWLMTNHPHDCPVCDEGGECHLQDMTVMTGHVRRRYRGTKRTFRNQDLGPFVAHEMNRCITCYRCVRFYRDYAGGRDLQALASKNHVYFGRHADGALESPFSGNLVEVCPTGVFTDRTLEGHYARKWDLQSAPSVCVHCASGCNILVGERYGSVRRVLNRYHDEVNGYFLCDRGRFGYDFVNGGQRLRAALLRDPAFARPPRPVDAATAAGRRRRPAARPRRRAGHRLAARIAGVQLRAARAGRRRALRAGRAGRRRASWRRGCRTCWPALPLRTPSLRDVEDCDAVVVLGEDVFATAPRLALALRQTVRNGALKHADAVGIPRWNDAAVRTAAAGGREPALSRHPCGNRHRRHRDRALPRRRPTIWPVSASRWRTRSTRPRRIRRASPRTSWRWSGRRPRRCAARSGRWSCRDRAAASEAVLDAAANVALALHRMGKPAALCLVAPECDSMGVALLGGLPLSEAFARVRDGRTRTLVVLENDLFRRAPRAAVEALLDAAQVVVLDHTLHATAQRADVALPAATFAEGSGTLVSSEGRAQRYFRALVDAPVRDSWAWIGEIAAAGATDGRNPWPALDAVTAACAAAHPRLHPIVDAAPRRIVPRPRAEDSAPAAALQRAHRDARRGQHPRAPAARGSRLGARVLDGGLLGRAAGRADHPLPGAGLELVPGRQQVPAGGSRSAARRARGKAPVRARRARGGGISQRHSRAVRGTAPTRCC